MNNMYPYNNGYQQAPFGYNYGTPRPQAKNTQPLSKEEIEELRRGNDRLSLNIPKEELMKCACTHREANGTNALVDKGNGVFKCSICSAEFKPFDGSNDDIRFAIKQLLDMLQTAKMIYLDAPDELIRQYFQIIPMLERFEKLWNVAMDNFSKYDGYSGEPIPTYGTFGNAFTALNAVLTNPYSGFMQQGMMYNANPTMFNNQYMQPQQQQMGYPQQMPQGQQYMVGPQQGYVMQPQQQQMGYPQQMPQGQQYVDPNNPMAYGVPTTPPQAPAPGVVPQPMQAAAPASDPNGGEIQQQKTFNV